MTKMRGIAVAMASLMATGAFAATTQAVSQNPSAAANKKILVMKKAPAKSAARPLTRAQQAKRANGAKLMAKNSDSASQQRIDSIQQSSSSATSAASMPGLTAGTSTAAAAPKKKTSALDKFRVGVLFEFYGPSVTDPFSGYQPDSTGTGWSRSDTSQQLDTTLIVGYRLSSNLTFTLNPTFSTFGDSADGGTKGSQFRFSNEYSSVRLSVGKFVKSGKFTWNGDFRVYPGGLGVSTEGRTFYFRSGQNFMYSMTPKTTLAMYGTYRHYQYTNEFMTATKTDADTGAVSLAHGTAYNDRITLSPAIEYQFTDSVVGSFSYNMDIRRQQLTHDIVNAAPYFEIGGLVDLSKAINLNPYIDIYPQRANVDAWQFGANVAINVL